MNAGQFHQADFQEYDEEGDPAGRSLKTDRRRWFYGIGLVSVIAFLVVCVFSILTCRISIFNNFLPFCPKPIVTPPTITKTFSPSSIEVNGVSTLTFTLQNSNSIALTGVTFTDALPSGLQVADLPSATTDCDSEPTWAPAIGTMTLVFGSPVGGTIPANGSCAVSINIKGTLSGSYESTSGYISSSNGGVNISSTGSATASIAVTDLPEPKPESISMAMSFMPDQILSNGTSLLTFTIANSNSGEALTDVTFSNTYPAGLTNATPLATTNTCEGTFTAEAGGSSVSLSEGVIPIADTCTVTVNVTASIEGAYTITNEIVSSTSARTDNEVSAVLYVGIKPMELAINFLKEVSTNPEGPWTKFINISPGTNIYYRFTIENLGNTPFHQFYVTDPALSKSDCSSLPGILPDANSGNNIATCVVGPITAEAGTHTNTATVSGTYADKPYTTAPSTATYIAAISPQTNLDLYLPDSQQKFSSQIQAQLDDFKRVNTGVAINIKYYSDVQSLKNGNTIGLFALKSPDVTNFAEQKLLLPVSALPQDRTYLADAIQNITLAGQLFAYPWQREICSSNYLNLAISAQIPADRAVVANNLSSFLTNEANQHSNFEAWQIYPTLEKLYQTEGESKFPKVTCPEVNVDAIELAKSLQGILSEKFGVSIDPSLAKELDAKNISGVPGQLAGGIAPVIDENQKYKGREVKGTFSINSTSVNSDLFDLNTLMLIDKGSFNLSLLPTGSYILACTATGERNCLAISISEGIEYQINPDIISDDENPTLVNIPFVRYEDGSIKKCFYVLKRKVCIRVFR